MSNEYLEEAKEIFDIVYEIFFSTIAENFKTYEDFLIKNGWKESQINWIKSFENSTIEEIANALERYRADLDLFLVTVQIDALKTQTRQFLDAN